MEKIDIFPKNELEAERFVLIFSLIVLVLAISIGSRRQVGTFGVESDFYGVYAIQAERILAGKVYNYQHNPPGYCLLLAAIKFFIGDSFTAAKLISSVSLAFLTKIIYQIFKLVFNYQIALIITVLTTLTLFPASFLAATDLVSALIIVSTIYLVLNSTKRYFLIGMLAGTAYLFRTNGIFLVVGIILVIFWFKSEKLRKTSWLIAGFMLLVTPWLIYNWKLNGSPFSNTAYLQIAAHFYHPLGDNFITSVQEMGYRFHSLSDVIFYQPFLLFKTYIKDVFFSNLVKLFLPSALLQDEYGRVLSLLPFLWIVIGLISLTRDHLKNPQIVTLMILSCLGYLILGLVGFHRRYYFFFYPIVFLLKVYPVIKLKRGKSLIILFLILGVFMASSVETYLTLHSEPKYLLSQAEVIKHRSESGKIMIVRKPHLAYLADLSPVFPLAKSAEAYLIAAREIGADYLVYSDYEATLWPGLKALSQPEKLASEFKLIYEHQPTKTLIYERIP
ncbi:glycosyltransferase family 39 protein [Gloeocapsa sp. PCC 73106]|uniref:ArnT family glycosyltransferase n=1 Tax=Gloeocapsa sp. PCC 73106 TaxID=102232 RepID=UPI0002AC2D52|nr:glycosyltransferase family 39 protein [Gloeocapsa sp. PCC 73106]ELR97343.1 hypothetical protein GLO73106DRAFT_00011520 [Gloeocapsa sp. PCC 73106]